MIRAIDVAGRFDVAKIPEDHGVAIPAQDGVWHARAVRVETAPPAGWSGLTSGCLRLDPSSGPARYKAPVIRNPGRESNGSTRGRPAAG